MLDKMRTNNVVITGSRRYLNTNLFMKKKNTRNDLNYFTPLMPS